MDMFDEMRKHRLVAGYFYIVAVLNKGSTE